MWRCCWETISPLRYIRRGWGKISRKERDTSSVFTFDRDFPRKGDASTFFFRVEESFPAKMERKRGERRIFFFFSKERKKAWNFSFFSPKKRSPKRLSFANSVSHRPRVKQKTGKEITAPFPGKIYFRESASDKVLDKVPLDGVPQKSTRASARGVEEINRLSEMKLGHWYLFLTVEV